MKIVKKIFASLIISFVILQGGLMSASAAEVPSEYIQNAKTMISNYVPDDIAKSKIKNQDGRFVNEMLIGQHEKMNSINQSIENAKVKGEKFYSLNDIFNADAKDFGISQADMDQIKKSVQTQKNDLENMEAAFGELGQKNHPLAKEINNELSKKYPKSMIYIDHSLDPQDGKISGGGWPYCLDNNGWGPYSFIGSDCYYALFDYWVCGLDSTYGKMSSAVRYCKAYVRNCSPLIGHSIYWHTH